MSQASHKVSVKEHSNDSMLNIGTLNALYTYSTDPSFPKWQYNVE